MIEETNNKETKSAFISSDDTKLMVPNRISIWLENQAGFDKYTKLHPNNPQYFQHFTSVDDAEALSNLDEGLDYCQQKINKEHPIKEYGFAFTKKVEGGIAGACYLYAEPNLQNDTDIATLESNIIALAQKWATDHQATMNTPEYNVGADKYLVITIDLQ